MADLLPLLVGQVVAKRQALSSAGETNHITSKNHPDQIGIVLVECSPAALSLKLVSFWDAGAD